MARAVTSRKSLYSIKLINIPVQQQHKASLDTHFSEQRVSKLQYSATLRKSLNSKELYPQGGGGRREDSRARGGSSKQA